MLIFAIHNLGDTALFRCAGRFVSGEEEDLQKAVLSQSHARTVVLDLAEVGTMDAAGIGVLVSLRASAQNRGMGFKMMNLNPRVEEVLALTHLREVFEVCSVREMLELLCHAVRQSRSEAPASIDLPGELLDGKVAEPEIGQRF